MEMRQIIQKYIAAGLITIERPLPPSYTPRGKYARSPAVIKAMSEVQRKAWTPERRAAQSARVKAKHAERKKQKEARAA